MAFVYGLLIGAALAMCLGLSGRVKELLLVLGQHQQKIQELEEDLADLRVRAVTVPAEYVYGEHGGEDPID